MGVGSNAQQFICQTLVQKSFISPGGLFCEDLEGNNNDVLKKILERIRFVGRSCKDIKQKYDINEGKHHLSTMQTPMEAVFLMRKDLFVYANVLHT